jgi:hypothetical protein
MPMDGETFDAPPSPDLELNLVERLALTSFRLAMMAADIAAEPSESKLEIKCRDRDAEVLRAIAFLQTVPSDAPARAVEFRNSIELRSRKQVYEAFCTAVDGFGAAIASRPRALMVFIDAVVFDPWSGKGNWKTAQREAQLSKIASCLPALEAHDLAAVQREHEASLRAVRLRSTQLAGSTAKVLARLPEPVGEALTSVGVWVKSFDTDVIEFAVRADLMTRLVAMDAEHDEEKAKRVVQSLQERLAVVVEKQAVLTEKLREMRSLNRLLSADNRELRRQLQEERERAQVAEAALRTALDHIFGSSAALPAGIETANADG